MIFKYKSHPRTKGSETIVTLISALMILGIGILGLYTSKQINEEDTGYFLAWAITAIVYVIISFIVQWIKSSDTMYSTLAITYNQAKGLYIYDVNDDSFLAGFNLMDYKIYPANGGYFSINYSLSRQHTKQKLLLREIDKRQIFENIIYSIKELSKKSNCIKMTYSYLPNGQNNFEREDVVRIYKGINDYKELYELLLKLKG